MKAIARGEAAVKGFQNIRTELERIRRTIPADGDKTTVDNMLNLNASSVATAERSLAAARADLALEESRLKE